MESVEGIRAPAKMIWAYILVKETGRNRVRGLRLKSDLSHHHHVAMRNLKCRCPDPAPGNELARSLHYG